MKPIIDVCGLRKQYGEQMVVKDLTFEVFPGQVFSILGTNGAGKSTLLNMLCTLLKPDSGKIYINGWKLGKENAQIRKNIGIVFQDSVLDGMLTVQENLEIRAGFYYEDRCIRKKAVDQVVEETKIKHLLKRYYGILSGGERRRVDIARALLHCPDILFLDEPTTGLDPKIRGEIWEILLALCEKNGITVVYSTHYMEEVSYSNHAMLMKTGSIIAEGSPKELIHIYCKDILLIEPTNLNYVMQLLQNRNQKMNIVNGRISIPIQSSKDAIAILQRISAYIISFEVRKATMEDVFIEVLGE